MPGKSQGTAPDEARRLAAFARDVGLAMVRGGGLRTTLQHCAQAMVAHLDAAFARIWTLNKAEDVLELQASAGMYTDLDGAHSRVRVGEYKIGRIAAERIPLLTNSVVGDPRVHDQEWAAREGMTAFAGYPLLVDDRLVGVMALFSRQPLSEATVDAMASVANGIAVGIERKLAEQRLRVQQQWLQVTLASIGDAVITTDLEGKVTFLNAVAEQLTGWRFAEAEGLPLESVFQIINEQTREPVDNPAELVLREGVIAGLANHTLLIAKDGEEWAIDDSAAPIRDDAGEVMGVVLIFRDVSDKRRAERELEASERRKAAILEASLDAVITIDREARVVEFNPAAERIFGYACSEVMGRDIADFIIPARMRESHKAGLARFLATGEGPVLNRRIELPALHADGSELLVEAAITPIAISGSPLFTAHLRDISERARAEKLRNTRLAVTHALAESQSSEAAVVGVLEAICKGLSWDVGFFWHVDSIAGVLRCEQSWHRPGLPLTDFETSSRDRTFASGEGLPGRVCETGTAEFLPNVARGSNFPRAALADREGLHSAFAAPVSMNHACLGVIEFFSQVIREPDADLLELIATVGGQLGQLLERRKAEASLRESEERFRQFAEHIHDVFWMIEPHQPEMLYVSSAYEEVWGRGSEELFERPRSFLDSIHADDQERVVAALERQKRGEETSEEYRVLRPDGSLRWIWDRGFPICDAEGRAYRVVGIAEDISERKHADDAVRFLADAGTTLAAVVDYESTLQRVAGLAVPTFADWCAVDLIEADGSLRRLAVVHSQPEMLQLVKELDRKYPPDPNSEHGVYRVLRTGEPELMEEIPDELLVMAARDAEHLEIVRRLNLRSFLCVPLVNRNNVVGVLTFVYAESGRRYEARDLTFAEELARRAAAAIENAKLYDQLREADRRKDEFLAMLAHELRNPLAPIRTGLEILAMERSGRGETIELMQQQVGHLVRLVDDLLDVSRIIRGRVELRREAVELSAIVQRSVDAIRGTVESRGQELAVSIPERSIWLDADPVRLVQVVENLLNNASKYTDEGGHIEIAGEERGGQAVIRVRDDGIGIEPDLLPHVFDLFTQSTRSLDRSQGGLGIGLTLVRNLVEMHGGQVSAASDGPGRGSRFEVQLPVAAAAEATSKPAERPAGSPGRRILVVDDNVGAARMLALLVRQLGPHEVEIVHDGHDAIEAAAGFRPEIILLDIGLPRMDGLTVAWTLRQSNNFNHTLLVALTGYGQDEDRRKSREAGFDEHLVKPVDVETLKNVLSHPKLSRES